MALSALVMIGAGFGVAALASADSVPTAIGTTTAPGQTSTQNHGRRGVFGKVTAVNGTTLTITQTNQKTSVTTTYTVDGSNAKVMKFTAPVAGAAAGTRPAPTTIAVSDIAVGDTVSIRGNVSGTSVTATSIIDGVMRGGGGFGHDVSGKITAVNGGTVTITDSKGTTYTIDASTSKLEKISTISTSDLAIGDTINVQGTVSGTSVTAKNIVDGSMMGGMKGTASVQSTTQ